MKLEKIEMYNIAMELGDIIWEYVMNLDEFAKRTIGNQIVRSSDSVAANISEGEGNFYYGDKKRYLYYSRGSCFETKTWLINMKNRKPLDPSVAEDLITIIELVIKLINGSLYKLPKK